MPTTKPTKFFSRYRPWQWIKHQILRNYLVPWAAKVGSTAPKIFVVDTFAGAGTYEGPNGEEIQGSPLIEARAAQRYVQTHPGRKMQVYCVERDKAAANKLSKRVAGFGDLVLVRQGNFAEYVDEILKTVGNAPVLLLLDPIGLKEIAAARCAPLLKRGAKTDVFVIVDFGIVHRIAGMLLPDGSPNLAVHAGAAKNAENIDAFFASPDWRKIAVNQTLTPRTREDAYLDLYLNKVLGDQYRYLCCFPVSASSKAPPQYWLIFASNHQDGLLLMNDEIVKVVERQRDQEAEDPGAFPGFASLMTAAAGEDVQAQLDKRILELVEGAPGRCLKFGNIRPQLLAGFFGQVKQGAYAASVKRQVKTGRLTRERRLAAKPEDQETICAPEKVKAG